MSVINESQKGDELVCLEEFEGPPQGVQPSSETNRAFRIGERVHYLGFYRHEHLSNNPVGWMVVFEAGDGRRYAATQTYFVTADCWEGLKRHFAHRQRKGSLTKKAKSSPRRRLNPKKQTIVSVSKKRRSA